MTRGAPRPIPKCKPRKRMEEMRIPEVKGSLRNWIQPGREDIILKGGIAYMTIETLFNKVNVSKSRYPAKVIGQIWKERDVRFPGVDLLCWKCENRINKCVIKIVDDKEFQKVKSEEIKNIADDFDKYIIKRMNEERKKIAEVFKVPKPVVGKVEKTLYKDKGKEIGVLVEKKNKAYGSAWEKIAEFLKLLFPDGIKPWQYKDVGLLVRVFDKQVRVSNKTEENKDDFDESPWQDVAGYGIIGAVKDDEDI